MHWLCILIKAFMDELADTGRRAKTSMIDDSAKNLSMEIEDSIKFREIHNRASADISRKFVGSHYRSDFDRSETLDNLVMAYFAWMLPELAYSHPACRVRTSRPVSQQQIADFIEMGLNIWLGKMDYGADDILVTMDMLTSFGVMMVSMQPMEHPTDGMGYNGGALIPSASHVPRDQFVMDGRCSHWTKARFLGHEYFRDFDWMHDNAKVRGYSRKIIDQLEGSQENYNTDDGYQQGEKPFKPATVPPRNQVRLVDLWIKERGKIYTMVMGARTALPMILREEDYDGPEDGPYTVYGAYQVPGDPYPISRIQAEWSAFKELNAQVEAVSEANKTYKRFAIVDAKETELKDAAMNVGNGAVAAVRNFNPQLIHEMQLGGAHPEQLGYLNIIRERFTSGLGFGALQAGKAEDVTATVGQIAQSNADGATAWVKECKYKATAMTMKKVMYYLIHNPNVVMEVSA